MILQFQISILASERRKNISILVYYCHVIRDTPKSILFVWHPTKLGNTILEYTQVQLVEQKYHSAGYSF